MSILFLTQAVFNIAWGSSNAFGSIRRKLWFGETFSFSFLILFYFFNNTAADASNSKSFSDGYMTTIRYECKFKIKINEFIWTLVGKARTNLPHIYVYNAWVIRVTSKCWTLTIICSRVAFHNPTDILKFRVLVFRTDKFCCECVCIVVVEFCL